MQIEVSHFEAIGEEQKILRSSFTEDTTISTRFEAKTTRTEGSKTRKGNTTSSTDVEVKKATATAGMTMSENAMISTESEWNMSTPEVERGTTQETKTPVTEASEVSVIISTDKNIGMLGDSVRVASSLTTGMEPELIEGVVN